MVIGGDDVKERVGSPHLRYLPETPNRDPPVVFASTSLWHNVASAYLCVDVFCDTMSLETALPLPVLYVGHDTYMRQTCTSPKVDYFFEF